MLNRASELYGFMYTNKTILERMFYDYENEDIDEAITILKNIKKFNTINKIY